MGDAPRLAGVVGSLAPVHQNSSRVHGKMEKQPASSPGRFTRGEEEQRGLAAVEVFGEIQNSKTGTARARFRDLVAKGNCRVEGKRFIVLGLRKGQGNCDFPGLIRVETCPARTRRKEEEKAPADVRGPSVREREGRGPAVGQRWKGEEGVSARLGRLLGRALGRGGGTGVLGCGWEAWASAWPPGLSPPFFLFFFFFFFNSFSKKF